jgi:protease-4
VLDKVGVEPQVQRIGAYKSAGDQLLRRDMSDAQREQLGELLDDIYEDFLTTVAEARGKTREVCCISHQSCYRQFPAWLFCRVIFVRELQS